MKETSVTNLPACFPDGFGKQEVLIADVLRWFNCVDSIIFEEFGLKRELRLNETYAYVSQYEQRNIYGCCEFDIFSYDKCEYGDQTHRRWHILFRGFTETKVTGSFLSKQKQPKSYIQFFVMTGGSRHINISQLWESELYEVGDWLMGASQNLLRDIARHVLIPKLSIKKENIML